MPSHLQSAPQILLVIDVQTAFFEGPSAVPDKEKLMENILKVLEAARNAGRDRVRVIFIRHNEPGDADFTPNTPPWELLSALSPSPPNEPIIDKTVPNSFHETPLAETISDILGQPAGAEEGQEGLKPAITIIGLQSDFCVQKTSTDAKKRYSAGKIRVVTGAHGTYAYEKLGLTAEAASKKVEKELESIGVEIVKIEDLGF